MNEPVSLQIEAPIPSKKNGRVVLKNGLNVPGKEFRRWHARQKPKLELLAKSHGAFTVPVSVSLGVSFGDARRRDLDNELTSVLDLLKDSGLLADDDWRHVRRVSASVLDTRAHYAVATVAPA